MYPGTGTDLGLAACKKIVEGSRRRDLGRVRGQRGLLLLFHPPGRASLTQLGFGVQANWLKSRSRDTQIAKVFSTTILFLLPIAPTIAQEKREEKQPEQKQQQQAKPAQQQQQQQQHATQQGAKPAQQQQHAAQPAKPAQPQQQQQRATQQETKPAQQQQQRSAQKPAKPTQQQHAAQQQAKPAQQRQAAQEPQRSSREQPAVSHGRIPDDRFRAS